MLKRKYLFLTLLVICGVLVVGGVKGRANFPEGVVDDFGYKVIINKEPERIVSLSPGNTEILFAIGAGDKLVGVTTYCNFPPEVKKIDRIGGFTTPNIEAILNKKPDLIIASYGNGEDNIKKLKELGIPVLSLYPRSVEDVLEDIKLVGKATGYENEAIKLVDTLEKKINLVKAEAKKIPEGKRPRVLYLVWYPELWAAGKGTFADDLIEIAGGRNIASDVQGWKIIGKEIVIDRDPDVIFCSGMGKNSIILKEKILQDTDLQRVSALKNGRVFTIPSDIVERPGPRIVEGLEKIKEYLSTFSRE
ncbi:ABC transporter substrate-binding protein [Candidatus Aerophobetes bacterium]|nr:ABC transporter substrate-binding protein [Candidatus Aerophobetes bacterium]